MSHEFLYGLQRALSVRQSGSKRLSVYMHCAGSIYSCAFPCLLCHMLIFLFRHPFGSIPHIPPYLFSVINSASHASDRSFKYSSKCFRARGSRNTVRYLPFLAPKNVILLSSRSTSVRLILCISLTLMPVDSSTSMIALSRALLFFPLRL